MASLVSTRLFFLVRGSITCRKVSFVSMAPCFRRSVQCLSTITSESGPLAVSNLRLKSDFQTVKNDKRDRHLTLDTVIEAPPKSRGKTIKETKAPTTKKTLEIDTVLFAAKSFSELGLPTLLLERLQQAGFSSPTDIQSTAIPMILQNHDVVIQSYTGSGKTLAYLLPILAEVGPLKFSSDEVPPKKREIEAVIVAPSRELGMQIVREVEKILGPSDKKMVQQLVGGANRSRQEEALKKNKPAIVVGTPGRIAEISAAGKLHTHSCRFLVLDEVDELLAFNFREDMHRILEHVGRRSGGDPNKGRDPQARKIERRTIMVSATVPFSVIRAARSWGEDPVLVKAKSVSSLDSSSPPVLANSPGATPSPTSTATTQQAQAASEGLPPNLKHFYCITKLQHKVDALRRCVHALDAQSVIVFMNHNRQLKDTVFKLQARGMNAAELHGDLSKLSRSTVLKKFKNGECRVLVTNELAARGLDVAECDLVVNLDLPTDSTHYAHRAGRTGRLGRKGIVVTICEQPEVFVVKKLERQLGVPIQACDFVEGKLLVTEKEEKP
ncbi:hypothetical protein Droror1_Dr00005365 [Drosera rotundifolia]